jgi:RNA polymerase sigma-70 factor (ECF subfamily)
MTHEQFMRLFLQSERELLRYVMALVPNVSDARDVVQETAVALWQASAKYDPSRPFIPWACRFALNEARAFLRRDGRRRRWVMAADVADLIEQARIAEAPQLDERRVHLRACIEGLPERQHQVVRGYYFDDQDISALSRMTGLTAEAVYKVLQRSRVVLQGCIEGKLGGLA